MSQIQTLREPAEPRRVEQEPDAAWRRFTQAAIIGLFIIALVALLYFARAILLPVISAVVVGAMLGPVEKRAAGYRIPAWLFATIILLLMLAIVQFAMLALSASIMDWVERAPEFAATIMAKLQVFERNIAAFRNLQTLAGGDASVKFNVADFARQAFVFLTPAIGELLVFFATTFFYLLSRNDLRHHFVLLFSDPEDRLRALRVINEIEDRLTRYVTTVTVINLALGLITAAGAWLLGFPNPLVLGTLAFACNYIPYVGPALVVVVLAAVGLVSFPTLEYAALPPALFVGLTTLEGHFITPKIVGGGLTLSPLAVVLGLTFWTWLWGPVGAFLSVPFLIIGVAIFDNVARQEKELPG